MFTMWTPSGGLDCVWLLQLLVPMTLLYVSRVFWMRSAVWHDDGGKRILSAQ